MQGHIASEVFTFFFFFFFFLEEVLPKFTLILLFYFHLIDSFTNQKKNDSSKFHFY